MNQLKQWDIFHYPFSFPPGPHQIVLISNNERCRSPHTLKINGLLCVSVRDSRMPRANEIFLDEQDGFEHKTAVACDLFQLVEKARLGIYVGSVNIERRRKIGRLIAESLRLLTI